MASQRFSMVSVRSYRSLLRSPANSCLPRSIRLTISAARRCARLISSASELEKTAWRASLAAVDARLPKIAAAPERRNFASVCLAPHDWNLCQYTPYFLDKKPGLIDRDGSLTFQEAKELLQRA